jgi:hypothetical protein
VAKQNRKKLQAALKHASRAYGETLAAVRLYLADKEGRELARALAVKIKGLAESMPETAAGAGYRLSMFVQDLTPREIAALVVFAQHGVADAFTDLVESRLTEDA